MKLPVQLKALGVIFFVADQTSKPTDLGRSRHYLNLRKTLSLILILAASFYAQAQTQTARYTAINNYVKGFYEYLPEGYDPASSETYPLLIFMHGAGERGDGSAAQLPRVLSNGVPKMIKNGTFPKSFTVNGQTHKFIVISPQFTDVPPYPGGKYVNDIIDYAVSHYKVNVNRIYLTGLSMGGGMIFLYLENKQAYADRIAAMVPICEAYGYNQNTAKLIANANIHTWMTHNNGDPTVNVVNTINYTAAINLYSPGLAKSTIFTANSHDAWTKTYDLNFREGGLNVFEWMLQYEKGGVTTPPGNQPPVVDAGTDKTITLPTNSVALNGTASDPNGSIASYSWSKVSGPASFTFSSATIAAPTVNNLTAGTYVFRLTVTDNKGATASDDVSVIVNPAPPPPNQAPTANAGPDKTITLPVSSTILSGSASDPDGSIASYNWTKISGPAAFRFNSSSIATPTVSNLTAGTYIFRLTATDNNGATASDDVSVVVNPAPPPPNQAPTVSAGPDKTITLPVTNTVLSGTASDADGSIASYNWTKVSGPASFTFSSATVAAPTVGNLTAGTYVFRLTVTDNKGATAFDEVTVVVNPAPPPPNRAPVVSAGPDKNITLPVNSTTLTGVASDPDGSILSYNWGKVSGPASFAFSSSTVASPTVGNLTAGTYVFRLTVSDNDGATSSDEVTVVVNAASAPPPPPPPPPPVNQAPVANAGADKTIVLPDNTVVLNGAGSDPDGIVASYAWSRVSGPASYTFSSSSLASPTVSDLAEGTYVFRLTVTDDDGATSFDEVTVTVEPAAAPPPPVNQPPVVSAGTGAAITLPVNSIILTGTAADGDGSIVSYSWSKVSGPASFTIVSASAAQTEVNSLVEGTYVFNLTVTDNDGATASDQVTIVVNAPAPPPPVNQPPVVSAGSDQTITLPAANAVLNGTASDADGSIVSYSWSKVSGPASFILVNASNAQTEANNLTEGTYVFRLTVTDDNGASAFAEVRVVVNAAPPPPPPANLPPVANAGADTTITLFPGRLKLSGSGTDIDGFVQEKIWQKISGPTSYTIEGQNTYEPTIANLTEGVYEFALFVTDNQGAVSSDTVRISMERPGGQSQIIYPNPVVTTATVRLQPAMTHNSQTVLSIYSISGVRVYTETIKDSWAGPTKQLNLQFLVPGTYIIELANPNYERIRQTFIKQ